MILMLTDEELNSLNEEDIDWKIHYVLDDFDFKTDRCDAHTHGVSKDHLELQVTVCLDPDTMGYILNVLGLLIRKGYKFTDGDLLFGLFEDESMALGFREITNYDNKPILRIIVPDEKGNVYVGAEGIFGEQEDTPYTEEAEYEYIQREM